MNKVEVEGTLLTVPELAELAKRGPVILMRHGKPLAAVKDLSGSDWESIALANNPRFLALIEESRRSYREHGGISLDALCQELGLTPKRRRKTARNRKALASISTAPSCANISGVGPHRTAGLCAFLLRTALLIYGTDPQFSYLSSSNSFQKRSWNAAMSRSTIWCRFFRSRRLSPTISCQLLGSCSKKL
jgi:hypothetical protein